MDAEATEEKEEKRYPCHILDEGRQNAALAKTIFHQGEAEITSTGEHDRTGKPDFKTFHVEPVRLERKAEDDVIDDRKDSRGGDTIV